MTWLKMTWLERHTNIKLEAMSRTSAGESAMVKHVPAPEDQATSSLLLTGPGLELPRHIIVMCGTCRLCRLNTKAAKREDCNGNLRTLRKCIHWGVLVQR